MAHADLILYNLQLYNKAQAKLKEIHKKILREEVDQYNGFVRLSKEEGIAAIIYKREGDARLWVMFWRGHKGEVLGDTGFHVLYDEFMEQYPEFGRRPVWFEDTWDIPAFLDWQDENE